MKVMKILSAAMLVCFVCLLPGLASAANKIDAEDFVEEVSAKGIAEIESAKLAQQKSTSPEIRAFAQKMIADHSTVNAKLAQIASQKNIKIADDAELSSKAKRFMMEYQDGQSFDAAYTKNQVDAHEDTMELFQRASISDDKEIAAFAKETLPKLQDHLNMAKNLAANYDKR